jgi:hypothetical protein
MQVIGLILILINIGAITAPLAGVAIVYQDHIQDVVIPPQITDMINSAVSLGVDPTTLAKIVAAEFDNASRLATLTINFTNPLNYTLNLKSLTAEIQCASHNYNLGQANLGTPIELPAIETTPVIIFCTWTQNAENHFQAQHPSESTINVNLVNFTVNFNDVYLQLSDPISIPNVPIA